MSNFKLIRYLMALLPLVTIGATIGATVASVSAVEMKADAKSNLQQPEKVDMAALALYAKELSVKDESLNETDTPIEAVTSVSQLTDVKPTDWAFQALQSLVERYGCIAGYPDKTFKGNRAITRYEFAAGLNSCMDRINDLISASTADAVKKSGLETLRKLQEQFAAELTALRGRVDSLEGKVATLQKQQFSTTTKLSGQVWINMTGAFTGSPVRAER